MCPLLKTIWLALFRRTLDIRTLPADSDLVPVEFPLYRKYQIRHHGEDPGEVSSAWLVFCGLVLKGDMAFFPCEAIPHPEIKPLVYRLPAAVVHRTP